MRRIVLLDTGPLVALLDRRDRYHQWARDQSRELEPPFLTCESVISEAIFLLRNVPGGPAAVAEMVKQGAVAIPFRISDQIDRIAKLLTRYANLPMSLADACLVRMSEQHAQGVVLTLDGHFRIYRRHGRQTIPTILADDR